MSTYTNASLLCQACDVTCGLLFFIIFCLQIVHLSVSIFKSIFSKPFCMFVRRCTLCYFTSIAFLSHWSRMCAAKYHNIKHCQPVMGLSTEHLSSCRLDRAVDWRRHAETDRASYVPRNLEFLFWGKWKRPNLRNSLSEDEANMWAYDEDQFEGKFFCFGLPSALRQNFPKRLNLVQPCSWKQSIVSNTPLHHMMAEMDHFVVCQVKIRF